MFADYGENFKWTCVGFGGNCSLAKFPDFSRRFGTTGMEWVDAIFFEQNKPRC